jgi:hypothetical protein
MSNFAMQHRFLDTIDTYLKSTIQPQIVPEINLDTILTIAEKQDTVNYFLGINQCPGSK